MIEISTNNFRATFSHKSRWKVRISSQFSSVTRCLPTSFHAGTSLWMLSCRRILELEILTIFTTYHLYVLFHTSVADPSRVLSVSKVLAFCKVTGEPSFLVQTFFEERVADAELAYYAFIINASVGHYPESYPGDLLIISHVGNSYIEAWVQTAS